MRGRGDLTGRRTGGGPMDAGAEGPAQPEADQQFPSWFPAVAVVSVLAAPCLSLIAALVMLSSEKGEKRRAALRAWAIGSALWLVLGGLLAAVVFPAVGRGGLSGSCKGGADLTQPPSYVSVDGVHWTATYACAEGGHTSSPVPSGQFPG